MEEIQKLKISKRKYIRKERFCKNKKCNKGKNNLKSILKYPEYQNPEKFCSPECYREYKKLPFYCQNPNCTKGEDGKPKKLNKHQNIYCDIKCSGIVVNHNISTLNKRSKILKGKVPWNKGLTKETDDRVKKSGINISKSLINSEKFHKTMSSKEYSDKISNGLKRRIKLLGYLNSPETRENQRKSQLRRIAECGGIPKIGKNETRLLNEQEIKDNCKIERQYHIKDIGWADGYCKETNTVYEVYEKWHKKQKIKDIQRRKKIIKFLKCKFIIIWDL
jgi:hypothetical protein